MFTDLLTHTFHNTKTHDLMEVVDCDADDQTWTVYNHNEGETTTLSHADFLAIADETTTGLIAAASGECVMVDLAEAEAEQGEDEQGAWELEDDDRPLHLMFR